LRIFEGNHGPLAAISYQGILEADVSLEVQDLSLPPRRDEVTPSSKPLPGDTMMGIGQSTRHMGKPKNTHDVGRLSSGRGAGAPPPPAKASAFWRRHRSLGCPAIRGGSGSTHRPGACSSCSATSRTVEGLLYADIDLGLIGVARAAYDPTGHYSRPDVLRLLFNKKPAERVHAFEGEYTEQPAAPADGHSSGPRPGPDA